jgi:transcription antitermination factor NusA-like protein
MKFLAPEVLAAAVIGKGGAVIAAMRQSCQAKIGLTGKNEVYPSTDCRVLTAQAATEESLNEVSKQIVSTLVEVVKSAAASEAVGQEGELKLKVLVPRAAVGGVIGKGGAAIKQLRETTSAKISIAEPTCSGPGAEQLFSVAGSAEALEKILSEVNHQIQLLNGEQWFSTWSTSTSTGGAASYGGYGYGAAPLPTRGYGSPGIDVMCRVAQDLPSYVMEDSRGFALNCVVPNRLVGGLIGRGGAGTKEVQMSTGTKIGIREIPDDPDNRSLNITGPLANTCAAYMLMMKRYLDAEAAADKGDKGQSSR